MPGPLVHRASAQQLQKLLQNKFPISLKDKWIMAPDINRNTHCYDMKTGQGSLIEDIESYYYRLYKAFNNEQYIKVNRLILYLNHLITDAHTIGQINKKFWINKDVKLDILGEFVWNKKSEKVKHFFGDINFDNFINSLIGSMWLTNTLFEDQLDNNLISFVLRCLSLMIKRSVRLGAEYTYQITILAMKETGYLCDR